MFEDFYSKNNFEISEVLWNENNALHPSFFPHSSHKLHKYFYVLMENIAGDFKVWKANCLSICVIMNKVTAILSLMNWFWCSIKVHQKFEASKRDNKNKYNQNGAQSMECV